MGFFRKLAKNVKDQAMRDQSVSIERLPNTVGGAKLDPAAPEKSTGLGGLLTGRTKRKKNPNLEAFYNSPMYKDFQDSGGIGTMDMYTASDGSIFGSGSVGRMYEKFLEDQAASKSPPAPTGIEALIRPQRTDPNNQQDMQRLMDMQKQTFRSFLAPPPVVQQPTAPYIPIDGGDLGLPMNPGTPTPGGVVFEPEIGNIDIQEILDNLPKGVGVGGIGNIPIPDIPYEIPQITTPIELPVDIPFQLPPELEQQIAVPQLPIDIPLDFNTYERVPDVSFSMPNPLDSVPANLPLQLPQIENVGLPAIQLPFEIPALPQVAMMPSVSPVAMPAMKMARVTPSMAGMRER